MVLFNYSTKELTAKVVYYGPGLCGKTTNLQWIHEKLPIKNKGKMLSLATETDRTLFFDFLPIELGTIRGMKTRIQLYTVPGQVFYNATRRMVLKGADCVVFVADSQDAMLDANIESFENLRENLEVNEIDIDEIPLVIQYNKRDLPNALPVETLNAKLNPRGTPHYEAVAVKGIGVEETLKGVTGLVFRSLASKYGGAEAARPPAAAPKAAPPAPPPPPPKAAAAPPRPEPPRPAPPPPPPPPPARAPEPSADELLDALEMPGPEAAPPAAISAGDGPELDLEPPPLPAAPPHVEDLETLPAIDELSLEEEAPAELPPLEPAPAPEISLEEISAEEAPLESLTEDVAPPPAPPPAVTTAEFPAPVVEAAPPPTVLEEPSAVTATPVSVDVASVPGAAAVTVPVEVVLGRETTQVNLTLRLTLKLKPSG
jgi:signal recognition particle receptor subunit beta